MKKHYSKSIESLSEKEVALVFSVLDNRTLSKRMREALLYKLNHGSTIDYTAFHFDVNRCALSKAEDKVVSAFHAMLNHFEERI